MLLSACHLVLSLRCVYRMSFRHESCNHTALNEEIFQANPRLPLLDQALSFVRSCLSLKHLSLLPPTSITTLKTTPTHAEFSKH
jgi:hypothetical protein